MQASGYGQSPDTIIRAMARLLDRMPRSARALWNRAQVRRFNVGIQAAFQPLIFQVPVRPETIQAVARLGAEVVITVYGAEQPGTPAPGVLRAGEFQRTRPARTPKRRP